MLKEFIKTKIEEIKEEQVDDNIIEYKKANKYIVPKSTVIVEIALKEGYIAKFDISNYFKEIL